MKLMGNARFDFKYYYLYEDDKKVNKYLKIQKSNMQ